MDEIADAAGVTKPVLYQHFPSKKQLYKELLDSIGAELIAAVRSSATAATPHQQVLAGFRTYFRFVGLRPNAFRLLFGTGARRLDEFADTVREVEDDLAAAIAGYINAGLDDEHRRMLGYAIVGLAEVTGRQWASAATLPAPGPAPAKNPAAENPAGENPAAKDPAGERSAGEGAEPLDPAEGERLADWLASLVWAGLRGLPRG